jgi:sulfur carrier protein
MNVTVNGTSRDVGEAATVAGLLETLAIPADRVVVEHNGQIVERARFGQTPLADGDCLEIVRFVGGG